MPELDIFPQSVLDSLLSKQYTDESGVLRSDGRDDPPGAMLAWALAGRFMQQPERWQPWMRGTTDNHNIQSGAAWIEATEAREEKYINWWMSMLDSWETEGECGGEQCPSGYDGHHISALVTVANRARLSKNEKLYERTLQAINRWVSLRLHHMCPPNSHRDVRLQSFLPGRRCVEIEGQVTGRTIHRDIPLLSLLRTEIPRDWKWPINQGVYVEDHIVNNLSKRLPNFSEIPREYPKLTDPLHFIGFENGYISWTPVSTMRTGRGGCILWLTKVNTKTGKIESISWKDPLGLPYNAKEAAHTGNRNRPYARQMGGGIMPGDFPSISDLGRQVRWTYLDVIGKHLVFGTRVGLPILNTAPAPDAVSPPRSPTAPSPELPPVEPPSPTLAGQRWRHVTLRQGRLEVVVRVSPPDSRVELLRIVSNN